MKSVFSFMMAYFMGGLLICILTAPAVCQSRSLPASGQFTGALVDQTSCFDVNGHVLCLASSNDLGVKYVDTQGHGYFLTKTEPVGTDIVGTFCPEAEYLEGISSIEED